MGEYSNNGIIAMGEYSNNSIIAMGEYSNNGIIGYNHRLNSTVYGYSESMQIKHPFVTFICEEFRDFIYKTITITYRNQLFYITLAKREQLQT